MWSPPNWWLSPPCTGWCPQALSLTPDYFFLKLTAFSITWVPTSIINSKYVKRKLVISTILYLKGLSIPLFFYLTESLKLESWLLSAALESHSSDPGAACGSTFLRAYTLFIIAPSWWSRLHNKHSKLNGIKQQFQYVHFSVGQEFGQKAIAFWRWVVFASWDVWSQEDQRLEMIQCPGSGIIWRHLYSHCGKLWKAQSTTNSLLLWSFSLHISLLSHYNCYINLHSSPL